MTIARPSLYLNFANNPGFIDPRWTYARSSTGVYMNKQGVLTTALANAGRWDFDPVTGLSRGLLFEPQRTNLFLRSAEFDNASWTKTNCTVTANSAVGPDGTTTLDTLAATAANGNAAQACTITAGNAATASVYARAAASDHLYLQITDGSNTVGCWFNLSAGTTGTNTAGASTCVFANKDIEALGGGLYRCSLTVTTATSTSFTVSFAPAAADNTAPANGNTIYAGFAQFEQYNAQACAASTYIPTTSATVTRGAEYISIPTTGPWYNSSEGTMLFEWVVSRRTPVSGIVFGGIGDTFSNTIYMTRSGNDVFLTAISGGVQQALTGRTPDWTIGSRNRFAMAWKVNDMQCGANGTVGGIDTSCALPVGPVRLLVGGTPYAAAPANSAPGDALAAVAYWPRRLSGTVLQTITAP